MLDHLSTRAFFFCTHVKINFLLAITVITPPKSIFMKGETLENNGGNCNFYVAQYLCSLLSNTYFQEKIH